MWAKVNAPKRAGVRLFPGHVMIELVRTFGREWKTQPAKKLLPATRLQIIGCTPVSLTILTFASHPISVVTMDVLHAPWRIQYILAPKSAASETSLFTRIAQSSADEENHVILRDRSCYAVLNTYPYTAGHLLVVPYKQTSELSDLNDDELCALMKMTCRCQKLLRKVMRPDGFNIGLNLGRVAGAGIVEHLHLHIVPRWNGDTNFMPVIANATVLPEALTETASKLRRAAAEDA